MSRVHQRFERLIDSIVEGRAVPFLGAGVSNCARCVECEDWEPTVYEMRGSLVSGITRHVDGLRQGAFKERVRKISGQLGLDIIEPPDNRDGFEKLVNVSDIIRFERLAEVHIWWNGAYGTCATIHLERFEKLCTLPAHRYLARLAREGLIREIITTNYDTCVEDAFRNTFFLDGNVEKQGAAYVVYDLAGYRIHGARREDEAGHPTLHVYKINGCARAWSEGIKSPKERERHSERILLTERQLHDFRDDRWAEELFRDRARCRSLIFSGFGADEPQVRYTFLALAAEFGQSGRRKKAKPWSQANAPFVTTRGDRLSFPHMQLLRAYTLAHGKSVLVNEELANVLGGRDRKWFDPGSSEDKLDADLLWERVFQAAWGRLLTKYTRRGAPFFRWLEESGVSDPARIGDKLRQWLYPVRNRTRARNATVDEVCGCRRVLLSEPDSNGGVLTKDPVMPLMKWMLAVQGLHRRRTEKPWEADYYLPLRVNSLLILGTLLLVRIVLGKNDVTSVKWESGWAGLLLPIEGHRVVIAAHSSEFDADDFVPDEYSALVVRVIIPSQTAGPATRFELRPRGNQQAQQDQRVRALRFVDVGADVLIRTVYRRKGDLFELGSLALDVLHSAASSPPRRRRARVVQRTLNPLNG